MPTTCRPRGDQELGEAKGRHQGSDDLVGEGDGHHCEQLQVNPAEAAGFGDQRDKERSNKQQGYLLIVMSLLE